MATVKMLSRMPTHSKMSSFDASVLSLVEERIASDRSKRQSKNDRAKLELLLSKEKKTREAAAADLIRDSDSHLSKDKQYLKAADGYSDALRLHPTRRPMPVSTGQRASST